MVEETPHLHHSHPEREVVFPALVLGFFLALVSGVFPALVLGLLPALAPETR